VQYLLGWYKSKISNILILNLEFILFHLSGIGCGIYTTNNLETCLHILKDTSCKIVVVENTQHLEKIIKCRSQVNIQKIIQYSGIIENDYGGLVLSVNILHVYFNRLWRKILFSHFFCQKRWI
jgi:hypothetical protein